FHMCLPFDVGVALGGLTPLVYTHLSCVLVRPKYTALVFLDIGMFFQIPCYYFKVSLSCCTFKTAATLRKSSGLVILPAFRFWSTASETFAFSSMSLSVSLRSFIIFLIICPFTFAIYTSLVLSAFLSIAKICA